MVSVFPSEPEVIMSGIILLSAFTSVAAVGVVAAIRTTIRDGYRRVPTRRS